MIAHYLSLRCHVVPAAETRIQEAVARYVSADPRVAGVYVDGRKDDKEVVCDNVTMSKRRAECCSVPCRCRGSR